MPSYEESGVNVAAADEGIAGIVKRIKTTWPGHGEPHRVMLDVGYFANVVDIGNKMGAAFCTDGVGSKAALCPLFDRYETIGIDCVAMNVNDLICVGALPISMVDYIAVEKADPAILDRIGVGLAAGAQEAGISIIGGEVSQLPDAVRGFDIAGAAFGLVPHAQINSGRTVNYGDIVIGIESNGVHSNGYSLIRKLFEDDTNWPGRYCNELGSTLGAELMRPTYIYVKEICEIYHTVPVKALVNITGDGLLNLNRVTARNCGFLIGSIPEPPPIFKLIQRLGKFDNKTMFEVFNMGIGFCIVVDPKYAGKVLDILGRHGRRAWSIGHVICNNTHENTVYLDQYNLVGKGKSFDRYNDHEKVG